MQLVELIEVQILIIQVKGKCYVYISQIEMYISYKRS